MTRHMEDWVRDAIYAEDIWMDFNFKPATVKYPLIPEKKKKIKNETRNTRITHSNPGKAMTYKSFKYRLYPTEAQKVLLEKHFGACRFIYNLALETYNMAYNGYNVRYSAYDLQRQLTDLKKDLPWLREVDSQSINKAILNLGDAFSNFFRGRGYPKFKNKNSRQSYTNSTSLTIRISNGKLSLPKFREGLLVAPIRIIDGNIKRCTISKNNSGKYYALVEFDVEHLPLPKAGKSVGIDLGLKHLAITSEGVKHDNPKHFDKYANKLKRAQQHLSRKKKGSRRYKNQRLKVALIHEKIANTRVDNLHKVTTGLVKEYDTIGVEALNAKGMQRNRKLSKAISDASWGEFIRQLTYKCEWNDRKLVKIDRFYPSSKTCSCGVVNNSLKLSDREWTCSSCGVTHDRDILAANNILKEAQRIIGEGSSDYTLRGSNKTSEKKRKPVKSAVKSSRERQLKELKGE